MELCSLSCSLPALRNTRDWLAKTVFTTITQAKAAICGIYKLTVSIALHTPLANANM